MAKMATIIEDRWFSVWLHVLAGIVWIGLLYYFNFVQVPAMGAALADSDDQVQRQLVNMWHLINHTLNAIMVPIHAPIPIIW
jgi:uncharacterized membrane protein